MSKISKESRQELVEAVAGRYQRSTRCERTAILDEFERITGYHRKHAIRLLRRKQGVPTSPAVDAKPRRRGGCW